jgi:hypothetical protein
MNANQFYPAGDHPSRQAKERMWDVISKSTGKSITVLAIRDVRSFAAGMAAAVMLLLSGTGLYSLVNRFVESREPQEVRFDDAYRSAIKEFEDILPPPVQVSSVETESGRLQSRFEQLRLIDSAISDLRSDISRTDLSPLKRSRLRQLYSMKLQVLQDIIQQGGMEL